MFWREVLLTTDLNRCTKVREALEAGGIPCRVRFRNRNSSPFFVPGTRSSRIRDISDGHYTIHVKKKELERAKHIIGKL